MEVPGGRSWTGLAVVADSLVANGASIASETGVAAELGQDGTEPTAPPGTDEPGDGETEAFEVRLKGVPSEHDGSTQVVVEVEFTKNPKSCCYVHHRPDLGRKRERARTAAESKQTAAWTSHPGPRVGWSRFRNRR